MKFPALFLISFTFFGLNTKAQDGSDIKYFNIGDIDTSYIGKTVHLDFYNRSFASSKRDTITILVNNKPIVFTEHREDDGFNNWFSRQYLMAIDYDAPGQLRIVRSIIKFVTNDSILVSNQFECYSSKNEILAGKSFPQDNWFNKKVISMVLVKSEQCCK